MAQMAYDGIGIGACPVERETVLLARQGVNRRAELEFLVQALHGAQARWFESADGTLFVEFVRGDS